MGKRFKFKLSRVISSLQFCRSTSAETLLPAIYRLSTVNPKAFDVSFPSNSLRAPPSTPECSFTKVLVPSKVIAADCGFRSGSYKQDLLSDRNFPRYKGKKGVARCHVDSEAYEPKYSRKISDVSNDGRLSPVWVKKNKKKSQRDEKENKTIASTSSRESGCFGSEEDENKETETIISINPRSLSNDSSSELDHSLKSRTDRFPTSENVRANKKVTTNRKNIRRNERCASKNYKGSNMMVSSQEMESPARASVLGRLIPCTVDGKLRESVAVVKISVDPYEDFKRSMLEMILEKRLFEAKDLEELLRCFLSLNSWKYHGIIVEAFSEIWEVLYCDFSVKGRRVSTGAQS